ncbi:MAG: PrsW family glutamic-type intramembrane protease [Candidatus Pacebacteria bacterium]|nr:PrsW family glutamic-type intramembrane protease [Candidatus Paceibacterota bacterium]
MLYLAVFLGLLPSFAWLLFYLREDAKRPEPKKMIFFAFLIGAAATFFAFFFEVELSNILKFYGISESSSLSFLSFSFIEEVIKFSFVFWFIAKSRYFDEPVDAMIYMIAAALGFAAIENIGAAVNEWNNYLQIGAVFHTITLRFIGATLLHSLCSAFIGYYFAQGIRVKEKFLFVSEGILLASLLHAFFNYLIINAGAVVTPTIFLLLVGLFVLNDFEKLKSVSA